MAALVPANKQNDDAIVVAELFGECDGFRMGARNANGASFQKFMADLPGMYLGATFPDGLDALRPQKVSSAQERKLSQQLDDSLNSATLELIRAARIREMEGTGTRGQALDAVDELNIPDRILYLLDLEGNVIQRKQSLEAVRHVADRKQRHVSGSLLLRRDRRKLELRR